METIPLQVVVVELENGRKGVFFGRPLVSDQDGEAECQVEEVYFSNVNAFPDNLGLAQLSQLALAQFEQQRKPPH